MKEYLQVNSQSQNQTLFGNMKLVVLISLAFCSSCYCDYLNSRRAAESILAKVNGDYAPRKAYFPNIYSHNKVWNANHTAYQITKEVNCVNGSLYFSGFYLNNEPGTIDALLLYGDQYSNWLKIPVAIDLYPDKLLYIKYESCMGITTDSPPTAFSSTSAQVQERTALSESFRTDAAPNVLQLVSPTAAQSAASGQASTAPTLKTRRVVPMPNVLAFDNSFHIDVSLVGSSVSCTTSVRIGYYGFGYEYDNLYWQEFYDQFLPILESRLRNEYQLIFQNAVSKTEICYLLN